MTSDPARELLRDAFGRVRDLIHEAVDGASPAQLVWRPDADANSVAWLVWHVARVQDDHLADVAGVEQAWRAQGFADRFGLPFPTEDVGYGQTSQQVGQVQSSAEDLLAYHQAVHQLTEAYLERIDATELARIVDDRWDPPVSASVRLISVVADGLQHLGQAGYVRGLADRAGV